MYLYLGQDTVLDGKRIIGVFDLDNASVSKRTRAFLNAAEKAGRVRMVGADLPKSFLVCDGGGKPEVILTQIATSTIEKRAKNQKIPLSLR